MFGELNKAIAPLNKFHAPTDEVYDLLRVVAIENAAANFGPEAKGKQDFAPFGDLTFPYFEMGAITSLQLFGVDELIVFSYYYANRNRYKKVADLGANIGLHSIILDRCGYTVRSYEPDPVHIAQMRANLAANSSKNVEIIESAVSVKEGQMEFVRVLGNTTGSHLAGSKPDPYGDLDKFAVEVVAVGPIMDWADLVKLDIEGHEKEVILATTRDHWTSTDAMMEVGSDENALAVFEHLNSIGVNMFAQKTAWQKVTQLDHMPTSHRNGSLFVSTKESMQWDW